MAGRRNNPAATPDVVLLVAAATRIQTGVAYVDWFGAWGYLPVLGTVGRRRLDWGVPAGAVSVRVPSGHDHHRDAGPPRRKRRSATHPAPLGRWN
jgi:hypothetical protein